MASSPARQDVPGMPLAAASVVPSEAGLDVRFDALGDSFLHLVEMEVSPLLECDSAARLEKILRQLTPRMNHFRRVWQALFTELFTQQAPDEDPQRLLESFANAGLSRAAREDNSAKVLGDWTDKFLMQSRIMARRNTEVFRYEAEGRLDAVAEGLVPVSSRIDALYIAVLHAIREGRILRKPVQATLIGALEKEITIWGGYIAPLRAEDRARRSRTAPPELSDAETADQQRLAELGVEEWAGAIDAPPRKASARRSVGSRSR